MAHQCPFRLFSKALILVWHMQICLVPQDAGADGGFMMRKWFYVIGLFLLAYTITNCKASEPMDKNEQINISLQLEKKLMESFVNKLLLIGRINKDELKKAKREIAKVLENSVNEN